MTSGQRPCEKGCTSLLLSMGTETNFASRHGNAFVFFLFGLICQAVWISSLYCILDAV